MIIESDFFRISSIKLPSGERHPVLQLEDIERELREIVNYPQLNNKNIISVVGEVGSGKTSILNNFLEVEDRDMPVGTNPTTMIPTYVVSSDEYSINGQNYMSGIIDIHYQIYKRFNIDYFIFAVLNFLHIFAILILKEIERWKLHV